MRVNNPSELAAVAKNARKKQKLQQTALAENASLTQQTISNFENSPESTKLDTLFRILHELQLDIDVSPRSNITQQWSEDW